MGNTRVMMNFLLEKSPLCSSLVEFLVRKNIKSLLCRQSQKTETNCGALYQFVDSSCGTYPVHSCSSQHTSSGIAQQHSQALAVAFSNSAGKMELPTLSAKITWPSLRGTLELIEIRWGMPPMESTKVQVRILETARSLKIYQNLDAANQFSINRHSVIARLQYWVASRSTISEEQLGLAHKSSMFFHSILKPVLKLVPMLGRASGKLGSDSMQEKESREFFSLMIFYRVPCRVASIYYFYPAIRIGLLYLRGRTQQNT